MKTSEKIKLLRLRKGLTQEELGAAVGVQKAAINKYETGRVINIKRSTLQSLARVLGVTPADLLDDGEPDNHASDSIDSEENWTQEELDQIETFKRFLLFKRTL